MPQQNSSYVNLSPAPTRFYVGELPCTAAPPTAPTPTRGGGWDERRKAAHCQPNRSTPAAPTPTRGGGWDEGGAMIPWRGSLAIEGDDYLSTVLRYLERRCFACQSGQTGRGFWTWQLQVNGAICPLAGRYEIAAGRRFPDGAWPRKGNHPKWDDSPCTYG
jgi:hypothetical protein